MIIGVKSSSSRTVRESETSMENHSAKIVEKLFRSFDMTFFSVRFIIAMNFSWSQSCNPLKRFTSSLIFSLFLISVESSSNLIFKISSSLFFVAIRISFVRVISFISWNSFLDSSKSSCDFANVWIFVWSCSIWFWNSMISFEALSRTNMSDFIFVSISFWCSNFILSCWRLFLSIS